MLERALRFLTELKSVIALERTVRDSHLLLILCRNPTDSQILADFNYLLLKQAIRKAVISLAWHSEATCKKVVAWGPATNEFPF